MITINNATYTDLIPSANQSAPNFVATVSLVASAWSDNSNVAMGGPTDYDLDVAVGAQLDKIGQWIGITRYLTGAISGVYFAFDDPTLGFDQGVWLGPFDSPTGILALPDDYYRLVLKARIFNNRWNGSIPDAYSLAAVVLAQLGIELFIVDHTDLTMDIGLVGTSVPTPLIKALFQQGVINITPICIHVLNYIFQTTTGPIFALDLNSTEFAGLDQSSWAQYLPN